MAEEKPSTFNPDFNKEAKGAKYAGMFAFGIMVCVIGYIITMGSLVPGLIVWLVGIGLIVFTLIRNFQSKHGSTFRIINIVTKIVVLTILLAVEIAAILTHI